MYGALDTATSALVAQRTNLDVIAGNIGMKESYRMEGDEAMPFRRRVALFAPGHPSDPQGKPGVRVADIVEDPTPFELRWAPDDPHAIKSGPQAGYVRLSNVDYHTEMVNAMVAARAYEANITVMEMTKSMAKTTLRLIA